MNGYQPKSHLKIQPMTRVTATYSIMHAATGKQQRR